MFRREDYWPYMVGVFLLAGLIINPMIFAAVSKTGLGYDRHAAGSLVACFVFAYAHTRDGNFSFGRFLGGAAIVAFLSLRVYARSMASPRGSKFVILIPGFLSFLTMFLSGWIGIWIGRVTGISARLAKPDPTDLTVHGASPSDSGDPTEQERLLSETSVEYAGLTNQDYDELLSRTREAWKSGQLSKLGERFQVDGENKGIDDFRAIFQKDEKAVRFAFTKNPPEKDEFLIMANDADDKLSFVLTNRHFYYFGLDDSVLATRYEHGKIALPSILRCETQPGFISSKATITLKTGEKIHMKGLMNTDPFKHIRKILDLSEPEAVQPVITEAAPEKDPPLERKDRFRLGLNRFTLIIAIVGCLAIFLYFSFSPRKTGRVPIEVTAPIKRSPPTEVYSQPLTRSAPLPEESSKNRRIDPLTPRKTPNKADQGSYWASLGNLYFDRNQVKKAIHAYKKSLALSPANPDVWTDLGIMYRRSGDRENARTAFGNAKEIDPKHQPSRYNLGAVLLEDFQDRKGAIKEWEQLLEINPSFFTPKGKPLSEMVSTLREGSGEKDVSTRSRKRVGLFSFIIPMGFTAASPSEEKSAKRQIEKSIAKMVKKYEGDTGNKQSPFGMLEFKAVRFPKKGGLIVVYTFRLPPQKSYLDQMKREQREKLEWGKQQGIIKKIYFHDTVEINETSFLKVDSEMKNGMRAINLYYWSEKAPETAGTITILTKPGQYRQHVESIESFISSIEVKKDLGLGTIQRVPAQENISTTDSEKKVVDLIRGGNWPSVMRTARGLAKNHSENSKFLYIADIAASVLDDHTQTSLTAYDFPYSDVQAMKALKTWARGLLEDDGKNANFLILCGMIHQPKGDGNNTQFTKYLKDANAIDGRNSFVLQSLGAAYGARGKFSLAIKTLEKAVEIRPTSTAYTNLGVAYLKKGKIATAEKNLKKAVEVDNQDGMAWFNLGSYYAGRNRSLDAKAALEKAVTLTPKNLEARWNLGGAYFNSGQRKKAIEQLREMIRIAPNSPMGRRAKGMLSSLGG